MCANICAPRQFNILAHKCKQNINKIKYFNKYPTFSQKNTKNRTKRDAPPTDPDAFSPNYAADMLFYLDKIIKE